METFQTHPSKDNSEGVMKLLKFIEKDAKDSYSLAEMGAYTQLAKALSEYLTNPMSGMINTFNSVYDNLTNNLQGVVKHFIKKNREYVLKAYFASKNNPLSFYIILKDDKTENRELFFEFIDNYEFLGVDNKIPISFSFLPNAAADIMSKENEIALD